MKVCPTCQARYSEGEVFCPNDGSKLALVPRAPTGQLVGTNLGDVHLDRLQYADKATEVYAGRLSPAGPAVLVSVFNQGVSPAIERFDALGQQLVRVSSPVPAELLEVHSAAFRAENAFVVEDEPRGPDLRSVLEERGPLDWFTAARMICQLARTLEWLDQHGVVHLGLNPRHVYLTNIGEGKIQLGGWAQSWLAHHPAPASAQESAEYLGHVAYLAPEALRDARQADMRSHIHSLGVLLFESVSGQTPWNASDNLELARRIAGEQTTAPSLARTVERMHPELDAVLNMMWARNPAKRFQTAGAVVAAMSSLLEQSPETVAPPLLRAPQSPLRNPPAETAIPASDMPFLRNVQLVETQSFPSMADRLREAAATAAFKQDELSADWADGVGFQSPEPPSAGQAPSQAFEAPVSEVEELLQLAPSPQAMESAETAQPQAAASAWTATPGLPALQDLPDIPEGGEEGALNESTEAFWALPLKNRPAESPTSLGQPGATRLMFAPQFATGLEKPEPSQPSHDTAPVTDPAASATDSGATSAELTPDQQEPNVGDDGHRVSAAERDATATPEASLAPDVEAPVAEEPISDVFPLEIPAPAAAPEAEALPQEPMDSETGVAPQGHEALADGGDSHAAPEPDALPGLAPAFDAESAWGEAPFTESAPAWEPATVTEDAPAQGAATTEDLAPLAEPAPTWDVSPTPQDVALDDAQPAEYGALVPDAVSEAAPQADAPDTLMEAAELPGDPSQPQAAAALASPELASSPPEADAPAWEHAPIPESGATQPALTENAPAGLHHEQPWMTPDDASSPESQSTEDLAPEQPQGADVAPLEAFVANEVLTENAHDTLWNNLEEVASDSAPPVIDETSGAVEDWKQQWNLLGGVDSSGESAFPGDDGQDDPVASDLPPAVSPFAALESETESISSYFKPDMLIALPPSDESKDFGEAMQSSAVAPAPTPGDGASMPEYDFDPVSMLTPPKDPAVALDAHTSLPSEPAPDAPAAPEPQALLEPAASEVPWTPPEEFGVGHAPMVASDVWTPASTPFPTFAPQPDVHAPGFATTADLPASPQVADPYAVPFAAAPEEATRVQAESWAEQVQGSLAPFADQAAAQPEPMHAAAESWFVPPSDPAPALESPPAEPFQIPSEPVYAPAPSFGEADQATAIFQRPAEGVATAEPMAADPWAVDPGAPHADQDDEPLLVQQEPLSMAKMEIGFVASNAPKPGQGEGTEAWFTASSEDAWERSELVAAHEQSARVERSTFPFIVALLAVLGLGGAFLAFQYFGPGNEPAPPAPMAADKPAAPAVAAPEAPPAPAAPAFDASSTHASLMQAIEQNRLLGTEPLSGEGLLREMLAKAPEAPETEEGRLAYVVAAKREAKSAFALRNFEQAKNLAALASEFAPEDEALKAMAEKLRMNWEFDTPGTPLHGKRAEYNINLDFLEQPMAAPQPAEAPAAPEDVEDVEAPQAQPAPPAMAPPQPAPSAPSSRPSPRPPARPVVALPPAPSPPPPAAPALIADAEAKARTSMDELIEKARAAQARGDSSEARKFYEQALRQGANNAAVYAGLGQTYFDDGNYERAAQNLAKAVGLRSANVEYRLQLGMAYFRLQRFGEASEAWQAVLRQDPNNEKAKRYIERLPK